MMRCRPFVLGLLFAGFVAPPATAAFGDKVQFDIQLPTGFERQAQSSPEQGVEAVRFVGQRRRDGTRPVLVVTTVRLPQDRQKRGDEALREMLVDRHIDELRVKYKVEDYARESRKIGRLHGVKLTWENEFGEPPRMMTVALLIAVIDRLAVIMRAEDLGEKRKQGMAAMDQAMSTFMITRR
jgi:hypothetical protein